MSYGFIAAEPAFRCAEIIWSFAQRRNEKVVVFAQQVLEEQTTGEPDFVWKSSRSEDVEPIIVFPKEMTLSYYTRYVPDDQSDLSHMFASCSANPPWPGIATSNDVSSKIIGSMLRDLAEKEVELNMRIDEGKDLGEFFRNINVEIDWVILVGYLDKDPYAVVISKTRTVNLELISMYEKISGMMIKESW